MHMNDKSLHELRALKVYSFILTIALIAVILMSFTGGMQKQVFTEIDVERINVIEKDGTLKMVISNQKRQHPGMMDGKMLPERQREAGMIFFNTEGDERSEEHTSELQSPCNLVCRLLLEKKKRNIES